MGMEDNGGVRVLVEGGGGRHHDQGRQALKGRWILQKAPVARQRGQIRLQVMFLREALGTGAIRKWAAGRRAKRRCSSLGHKPHLTRQRT